MFRLVRYKVSIANFACQLVPVLWTTARYPSALIREILSNEDYPSVSEVY